MNKSVRTRFAPSPTGMLHVGGVRTALFAYLYAKSHDGTFVLRLEDTDRERFVEGGVEQIIKSLDWLGIHPDEGVWYEEKQGNHGPYIQSKRLPHYKKYAEELVSKGLAYYSSITPESFAGLREEAIQAKRPFVYKYSMEPKDKPNSTEGLPIRLKISDGETEWNDEVRGVSKTPNNLLDDFVILKADGFPTYNFANVIDDHLMEITHVIRGDEFISTTAKHALLYDLLEFERPSWVHLPVILGPDGKKKMSKRDGDVDVLEFEKKGYLKQSMVNFLALLGWNDGSEQEIFSLKELIDKFSIERVQKSPAVFDIARLDWMNGEYIRKLSISELLDMLKPFIPSEWYSDIEYLQKVVMLDRERLKTLADARYLMEIFFETPNVDIKLLTQKDSIENIKVWLQKTIDSLEETEFTHDTLEKTLRQLVTELDIKTGQLFYALRIALTGRTEAPGLFDIMLVLGKEETVRRLNREALQ
jgi:glutamyl-tRNA synthetase